MADKLNYEGFSQDHSNMSTSSEEISENVSTTNGDVQSKLEYAENTTYGSAQLDSVNETAQAAQAGLDRLKRMLESTKTAAEAVQNYDQEAASKAYGQNNG